MNAPHNHSGRALATKANPSRSAPKTNICAFVRSSIFGTLQYMSQKALTLTSKLYEQPPRPELMDGLLHNDFQLINLCPVCHNRQ